LLNEDDVDINISGRDFIPIEKLDSEIINRSSEAVKPAIRSFFTIGVIVDISAPLQSKNNKKYRAIKVSDLVKYDIFKVKKHLEKTYSQDKDGYKMAEKSFNSNGYKVLKIMVFDEAMR
jgi:hypothetical protein